MPTNTPTEFEDDIAQQIAKLANASVQIEIDLVKYLSNDIEKFKTYARENNISKTELTLSILRGIERGLIEYGKIQWQVIKDLLSLSKTALEKLMKNYTVEK